MVGAKVETMIKDILQNNENLTSNTQTLEVLHTHFPQCFNKEGNFDIDKFKELVRTDVDVTHEGYDLNFLGKNYAKLLASVDTTTVIQPDVEHNTKPENANSQNLYISGDNLDGLKHLLKSYSGAVKCIYIDPPYNTGTDGFVYNDKFNYTNEELTNKLSISDEQAQKILDLTTKGRASHSAWLTFMYPRLLLARDLLKPDGVIFISIDDNEQANLKLLCDSVFGEENFVTQFSWQKKTGASDAVGIATITENIITYTRNKEFIGTAFSKNENSFDENRYDSKDEYVEERGSYYPDNLDRGGLNYSDSLNFGITCPDGTIAYPNGRLEYFNDGWIWKWSVKKVQWGIENGFIEFRKSKTKANGWAVCYKNYMYVDNEGNETSRSAAHKNLLLNLLNTKGTSDLKTLFNQDIFKNSKPVDLILELISYVNLEEMDIIVDFFSGSATTAQSVLKLNSSENAFNKKIRFILIQLKEECNTTSKAYLSGYKTIDEIGQERIRLAAAKIKSETGAAIDYGFKHYTLVEPSVDTLDKLEEFKADEMFTNNDTLSLFGKETVLETWLVKDGYGFGTKVQEVKLADSTAHLCGKHLYFIEAGIDENDMVALLDKYQQESAFSPENIVVFGYSFNFSQTEMLRKNLFVLKDSHKNLKANFDIRY